MASENSGGEGIPLKPRTFKQFKRHSRKLGEKRDGGKDGFEEEFLVSFCLESNT
jgi:hypothetical protein